MKPTLRTRFGLYFWSRASDQSLTLAAYHPPGCPTWHWSVSVYRLRPGEKCRRDERRWNQWHDTYRLPFGYALCVSRQDYHLQGRRP